MDVVRSFRYTTLYKITTHADRGGGAVHIWSDSQIATTRFLRDGRLALFHSPRTCRDGVSGQQVERITSYERTHSPCCGCRSRPRLRRRATQGSAGSRPRRYRARHAPASPPPPVGPTGYTVRHHVSSLTRRTCSHSGSSTSLEVRVFRNPPTGWGMGKPGFPIPLLEGCAPHTWGHQVSSHTSSEGFFPRWH